MPNSTAISILRTLAFFAAHHHAITLLELQALLLRAHPDQQPITTAALQQSLNGLIPQYVSGRGGLYTLPGYEKTINRRREEYNYSAALLKKAKRWATALRHIPYVRAVAVSGSAALLNAGAQSDIDLFIITEPGRMFCARFFVSAFFQIIGRRRHGEHSVSRFCLNHYIITELPLTQDRNIYTASLYTNLLPLFGRGSILTFLRQNAEWINSYLLQPKLPSVPSFAQSKNGSALQRLCELLLFPFSAFIERGLRAWQMRRIHTEEYVIVSDQELAFHPASKGQAILRRYDRILDTITL